MIVANFVRMSGVTHPLMDAARKESGFRKPISKKQNAYRAKQYLPMPPFDCLSELAGADLAIAQ